MKKTYDYLSKYEELKNLYLETNEVFEFKPEEIEEIVETIIYEEKIDSLSYDGLNESQISFVEEVKEAISKNSDNIKKAFKAFKKSMKSI